EVARQGDERGQAQEGVEPAVEQRVAEQDEVARPPRPVAGVESPDYGVPSCVDPTPRTAPPQTLASAEGVESGEGGTDGPARTLSCGRSSNSPGRMRIGWSSPTGSKTRATCGECCCAWSRRCGGRPGRTPHHLPCRPWRDPDTGQTSRSRWPPLP